MHFAEAMADETSRQQSDAEGAARGSKVLWHSVRIRASGLWAGPTSFFPHAQFVSNIIDFGMSLRCSGTDHTHVCGRPVGL